MAHEASYPERRGWYFLAPTSERGDGRTQYHAI
jgi:hypothetical protein